MIDVGMQLTKEAPPLSDAISDGHSELDYMVS